MSVSHVNLSQALLIRYRQVPLPSAVGNEAKVNRVRRQRFGGLVDDLVSNGIHRASVRSEHLHVNAHVCRRTEMRTLMAVKCLQVALG
jgi:hypothetical protein